ncbi:adenosine deaminase, putative [Hepatocystis sp. ex Piliocolobus tephrosceles]|nr:adenosine deaminase, putative [Hepatocystis sp. ex Piliocolobus tephrosceles]
MSTSTHEEINFLKKSDIKSIDLSKLSKEERYSIWRRLPKCELHCHLDLCFTAEFFLKCIKKFNLEKSLSDEEILDSYLFTKKGKSLSEFVDKALKVSEIYKDYETLEEMAYSATIEKYKEGVVIMEFRYSPTFVSSKHNLDVDLIHKAFVNGINKAVEEVNHKIHVGLICIGDTGHPLADIKKSAEFCIKNKKDFIGFDHGGYEVNLERYRDIFNYLTENGIPLSIHAGEDVTLPNLDTLYTVINILKVKRIGHGIRVSESKELINLVKEKDLILEINPISNDLLSNVKSISTHPIRYLYDQGVKVSVNSDDPGMFLAEITDNYEQLYKHLNFTLEEFMQMNKWAIEKSFVDEKIKTNVLNQYF